MLKDISITKKIILGFFILYIILWGSLMYISSSLFGGILAQRLIADSTEQVSSHAKEISDSFNSLKSDIFILSNFKELKKIINLDLDDKEYNENIIRLSDDFKVVSSLRKDYMQIRYIDENGNEIVRVDRDKDKIIKVLKKDLQNKKDRYYFTNTMALSFGELFISQLDLNREGSPPKIEEPYKPVIRYATPLYNDNGEKKGIIIINVNVSNFLDNLRKKNIKGVIGAKSILVDQDGYYLVSPDKEKEWGSPIDLNTGYNIQKDYPKYSKDILSGRSGYIDNGLNIVSYSIIKLYDENDYRFLVHIMIAPKKLILYSVISIVNQLLLYGLLLLIISMILIYFYSRSITLYLRELLSAISQLSSTNLNIKVPVRSKDEIGKLANAFNALSLKLKKSKINIDKKIQKRTQDLENINKYMIGRELKMLKLKRKIKDLLNKQKDNEDIT